MKLVLVIALVLSWTGVTACVPYQVFPPEALAGLDPSFEFARWRAMPNQMEPRKVQLGGRIVQADVKGTSLTIVVAYLPIVEHPAYGPMDTGKRSGEYAVLYEGRIEPAYLQTGNRMIVVGTTRMSKVVMIDDIPRTLPAVSAQCLHFWNTGGREIADFPSYGAGYETLEEQTSCTSAP